MAGLFGFGRITSAITGLVGAVKTAVPYIEKLARQGAEATVSAARSALTGIKTKVLPLLAPSEIARQVRSAGLVVDTKQTLEAVDQIRKIADFAGQVNAFPGSRRPLKSSVPYAVKAQKSTYYIQVLVSTYNPDSGIYNTRNMTLRSNRLMSNNEIAAFLNSQIAASDNYEGEQFSGHVIQSYTQRAPTEVV